MARVQPASSVRGTERSRRRSSLLRAGDSGRRGSQRTSDVRRNGPLALHPAFVRYQTLRKRKKSSGMSRSASTAGLSSAHSLPSVSGTSGGGDKGGPGGGGGTYWKRHVYGTLLSIIERPRLRPYALYYIQVKFLPVLWLFLDFFQMTLFNRVLRAERSLSCSARSTSEDMADFFRSVTYFWIALSAVMVGVAIVIFIWLWVGKQIPKVFLNLVGSYVNVLSTFLYTFILRQMWQEAMCHMAHSEADEARFCDTADGRIYLILALPVSIYFLSASVLLALNSFEVDPNATHVLRRSHGIFDVLYIIGKTVIVALSFIQLDLLRAVCNLVIFILLFLAIATLVPHHVHAVNRLRTGLHLGMVLSAATSVVTESVDECWQLPALIYYIAVIPVIVMGALFVEFPDSIRYRAARVLERVFSPFVFTSIRSIMDLDLVYLLVSATRLGQVAYELEEEDPDQAEKYYLRAHAADRNHVTNLGRFAFHLVRTAGTNTTRRLKKAVALFDRALGIDRKNAEVLALYGVYKSLIEKSDVAADELYRQSVQVTRDSSSLRRHFSSRNEGLLIINALGKTLECNALVLRMFCATTREAFLQVPLFSLSPLMQTAGASSALASTHIQEAIQSPGKVHRFEWEFIRLDSATLVTEVALTAMSTKVRGQMLLQVSITDVSSTGTMQDRNSKLAVLLATMSDGVINVGDDGMIMDINPSALTMLNIYNINDLINTPFLDLLDMRATRALNHGKLTNSNSQRSSFHAGTARSAAPSTNPSTTSMVEQQESAATLPGIVEQQESEEEEEEIASAGGVASSSSSSRRRHHPSRHRNVRIGSQRRATVDSGGPSLAAMRSRERVQRRAERSHNNGGDTPPNTTTLTIITNNNSNNSSSHSSNSSEHATSSSSSSYLSPSVSEHSPSSKSSTSYTSSELLSSDDGTVVEREIREESPLGSPSKALRIRGNNKVSVLPFASLNKSSPRVTSAASSAISLGGGSNPKLADTFSTAPLASPRTLHLGKRGPFLAKRRKASLSPALAASMTEIPSGLTTFSLHTSAKSPPGLGSPNGMTMDSGLNFDSRSCISSDFESDSRATDAPSITIGAETPTGLIMRNGLEDEEVRFMRVFRSVMGQTVTVFINRAQQGGQMGNRKSKPIKVEMSMSEVHLSTSQHKRVFTVVFRDLRFEEQLSQQEDMYRWLTLQLADQAPAIVVFDAVTLVIGEFNGSAARLFKTPPNKALERNIIQLFEGDQGYTFVDAILSSSKPILSFTNLSIATFAGDILDVEIKVKHSVLDAGHIAIAYFTPRHRT